MNKFFEDIAVDLEAKFTAGNTYRRYESKMEISKIVDHLENMVNCFGISYPKLYDEIASFGEIANSPERILCESNLSIISLLVIWYYANNPAAWIDGRNEISAAKCQHIYGIKEFHDFYADFAQVNHLPTSLDDLKDVPSFAISPTWVNFIKIFDERMHRTNVQTSIGFMLYFVAHSLPEKVKEAVNNEMSEYFGEDYWRMPLI